MSLSRNKKRGTYLDGIYINEEYYVGYGTKVVANLVLGRPSEPAGGITYVTIDFEPERHFEIRKRTDNSYKTSLYKDVKPGVKIDIPWVKVLTINNYTYKKIADDLNGSDLDVLDVQFILELLEKHRVHDNVDKVLRG